MATCSCNWREQNKQNNRAKKNPAEYDKWPKSPARPLVVEPRDPDERKKKGKQQKKDARSLFLLGAFLLRASHSGKWLDFGRGSLNV